MSKIDVIFECNVVREYLSVGGGECVSVFGMHTQTAWLKSYQPDNNRNPQLTVLCALAGHLTGRNYYSLFLFGHGGDAQEQNFEAGQKTL